MIPGAKIFLSLVWMALLYDISAFGMYTCERMAVTECGVTLMRCRRWQETEELSTFYCLQNVKAFFPEKEKGK